MNGMTDIHPDAVLASLLDKGGRSNRRANLAKMHELCRRQHAAGSRDFSLPAIGRLAGLIMVAVLLAYVVYAYVNSRGSVEEATDEEVKHETLSNAFTTLLILGGLGTLFVADQNRGLRYAC